MTGADAEPYRDPSLPVAERVDDLLGRMTLEEKVAQLGAATASDVFVADAGAGESDGVGGSESGDQGGGESAGETPSSADGDEFDRERAEALFADGIGELTRLCGEGGLLPREGAIAVNECQELVADARLGIPALPHEECLSGYMGPGGTTFPQAIGLASTWDPDLVAAVTTEVRHQLQAIGAGHALSPVLDLARDLRWGRTEETFGEDPYLVARMGCAYVSGLQGSGPADGVAATVKHFVGHGASRGGKNRGSVALGPRDLQDHLFPFEAAVREADVEAVMNAYHDVDGIPCASSRALLTETLREDWDFDGVVVADYGAVANLRDEHEIVRDDREAAVAALEAGIDVELPRTDAYAELVGAVEDGDLDEAVVDRAVRRVLRTKVRKGLFEADPVDPDAAPDAFETDDQRALARRAARESITLLRDDEDVLPLSDAADVAVVGPKADATEGLLGDYAYLAHFPELQDEDAGIEIVSPLGGIEARLGRAGRTGRAGGAGRDGGSGDSGPGRDGDAGPGGLVHVPGCTLTGPSTDGIDDAVAAAADADVAVAFVGGNSTVDHSDADEDVARRPDVSTSGEGRDVTDLGLPGVQEQLLDAVAGTGTPLVVVVLSGKAHALESVCETASAVLHAWLPGEEGGNGIADVLFGDHGPSGRLPVSLPRTAGQLPVNYDRRPNDVRFDYVYEPAEPLFPFGHGETYTEFAYRDLALAREEIDSAGSIEAAVTVENVGDRAGHEVVQWYARELYPPLARPVRKLRGFERVHLESGETARVEVQLDATQLAFLDETGRLAVHPGEYELEVGRSAEDRRDSEQFEIVGEKRHVPTAERELFSETAVESAGE